MRLRFINLFFVNKQLFAEEKLKSHERHHRKTVWAFYACGVLALWLIAGPLTISYEVDEAYWNDIICGILLLVLSVISLKAYNLWAKWAIIFLGLWLLFAPLFFEVKEEAAYLNDTLIATLIITFSLIIPGEPGIKLFSTPGPNVPPGWNYNPSAWSERIPVITLAWIGFFVGRYLGSYQLEFIQTAWDPFFDEGTRKVLTSKVSESFPVSDGMLGAVSYILDVLFGKAGGIDRWRTMPWVVIIFAILIIPLGAVSITLVILQPVTVGYWCTLCLTSALISLSMIPFTLDEALASIQFLIYSGKKGEGFWKTFWFGGPMEGGTKAEKSDPATLLEYTAKTSIKDFFNKPWNLFLSVVIGIWIMFAPAILNYPQKLADSNHLVGALIVSFSIIAMSEVARIARFINILFSIWIIGTPLIMGTDSNTIIWANILSGLVIIPISFPKGKIEEKRGNFDKYIY